MTIKSTRVRIKYKILLAFSIQFKMTRKYKILLAFSIQFKMTKKKHHSNSTQLQVCSEKAKMILSHKLKPHYNKLSIKRLLISKNKKNHKVKRNKLLPHSSIKFPIQNKIMSNKTMKLHLQCSLNQLPIKKFTCINNKVI